MSEQGSARDYSKRYWDASNFIAAFAIAQSLAFIFAYAGNCPFRATVSFEAYRWLTIGAILIAMAGYVIALNSCHKREVDLLAGVVETPLEKAIGAASAAALKGRIVAVILFSLLAIGILLDGIRIEGAGPGCLQV